MRTLKQGSTQDKIMMIQTVRLNTKQGEERTMSKLRYNFGKVVAEPFHSTSSFLAVSSDVHVYG